MSYHTIEDYFGGEKDLVTSPPKVASPETIIRPSINPITPMNISLSPQALGALISTKYDPKLCNEVTITFSDKWIIPYNVNYIQIKLQDFLRRWSKVANYIMVQDYSKTGRLHYHGILEMQQIDRFERLIINLRKTFGRVECKQIAFWESYIKYMLGIYDPLHEKFSTAIEWHRNRYITNKLL